MTTSPTTASACSTDARARVVVAVLAATLGCANRTTALGVDDEGDASSEAASGADPGTDTDTGPDLPQACDPGGDASVAIELLGVAPDPIDGVLELDLACTFVEASAEGQGWLYTLDACTSLSGEPAPASLSLAITSEPAVAPIVDPGTVVRLRYVRDSGLYDSFVLTAQPGGLLLLAGHVGDGFGPGFEPLTVTASERGCAASSDGCSDRFAQRLRFEIVDASVELIAGEAAEFGQPVAYQAILASADRFEVYPDCFDVPASFSRYLVVLLPDD